MSQTTVNAILTTAKAEIGYKEKPSGSNRTKYGKAFGLDGYSWCAIWIWWIFNTCGAADLLPVKTGSCSQLMQAAQLAGLWVTDNYRPGDLLIYNFPGGAKTDHCGILETINGKTIHAIEGNTSLGNDSNGGEVMRRVRTTSMVLGAVRPLYSEEEEFVTYKYLKDIPEKFRPTIEKLMDAGVIQGDGSDSSGNGDVINLTHEQVRTLVFMERRLESLGLTT